MNQIKFLTYGYIRVSTREQNEDRQVIALQEAGVAEENIYMDKQSGKDFDRPQYKKLLRKMKKDDLLYSRASTVWGATTRKFWSTGGSLQRTKASTSWCWICRCWIPGAAKT